MNICEDSAYTLIFSSVSDEPLSILGASYVEARTMTSKMLDVN